MNDQVLYQAGPGEMIEYARLQEVTSGNVLGPQPSETHHDVLVPLFGAGTVRWDDQEHELSARKPVILPHGARYELESLSGQDMQVMIFGVALIHNEESG